MDPIQTEFFFAPDPPDGPGLDGVTAWRRRREEEIALLCSELGLPLNHFCEIRLKQGPVLRGHLRLAEDALWIDHSSRNASLEVAGVPVGAAEIESAVRLD